MFLLDYLIRLEMLFHFRVKYNFMINFGHFISLQVEDYNNHLKYIDKHNLKQT